MESVTGSEKPTGELAPASLARVRTVAELSHLLRQLRRREARRRGGRQRSYRELATRTGWSHGVVGDYLAGKVLPPTDRFDLLVALLGASREERGLLATARDRVEEARRSAPTVRAPGTPRQLPADVAGFSGRTAALTALDALLDRDGAGPGVLIPVVTGTAGVGKTALAIRWAHRVADRFPDGQLYLDLEGYGPGQPVDPDAALATLLRGLGVRDAPGGAAERAARYRTLLAGRRVLVVLDNAGTAEQVRPLLPGVPSCLTLVTSRDDLAGLVAREGAHRVALAGLDDAEAVGLLRRLIGPRVDDEPGAAVALARHCAGLPLALRIAAELLTTDATNTAAAGGTGTGVPDAALIRLVAELRDERRRLDVLDATGDPRATVAVVFGWSHRRLPPEAAQLFALLGLHPGRVIDEPAAAHLAGADSRTTRRHLVTLARANLIDRTTDGRYALHDLLRAYAVRRAAADLDEPTSRAALTRLLGYYRRRTAATTAALLPHRRRSPGTADPAEVAPTEPSCSEASSSDASSSDASWSDASTSEASTSEAAWLEAETPNLVATAVLAAESGPARHAVELSRLLWLYLDLRGRHHEASVLHAAAARAADGDPPGRAAALASLALARERLGQRDEALRHIQAAIRLSREAGDVSGEARALGTLGAIQAGLGRYPESLETLRRARDLYQRVGDRHGTGVIFGYLGLLHERLGAYQKSARLQRRAATALRRSGDPRLEGYALANLGILQSHLGQHVEALDQLGKALARCAAAQDLAGTGHVLGHLGTVYARLGRFAEAVDHLDRALAIGRTTGNRSAESDALHGLGETWRAMDQPERGYAAHEAALAIAEQTGHRRQQARALDGMGLALRAMGRPGDAAQRWRRALAVYEELALPEATALRERLREMPGG